MSHILYLVAAFIITINKYNSNITLEGNSIANTKFYSKEITEVFIESTFKELVNPVIDIKHMRHLLARRKGDTNYGDLKVCWKVFIENLDQKRRNPDQVVLNKRYTIA